MKKYYGLITEECFYYNEEANELIRFTPFGAKIDLKTDKVIAIGLLGGKYAELPAESQSLYKTQADFEKRHYDESIISMMCGYLDVRYYTRLAMKYSYGFNDDNIGYRIVDNAVKKVKLADYVLTIGWSKVKKIEGSYLNFDNLKCFINANYDIYPSYDIAFERTSYNIVDELGNTQKVEGKANLVKLNDKQSQLWERFKALMDEMEGNEMGIVFDNYDYDLIPYSKEHIVKDYYDCCNDKEGDKFLYDLLDRSKIIDTKVMRECNNDCEYKVRIK